MLSERCAVAIESILDRKTLPPAAFWRPFSHRASGLPQYPAIRFAFMKAQDSTSPPSGALTAIRTAHTVVWAFFAGCIVAIPVASWRGEHRAAAWLIAIVFVEVCILLLNGMRCPLTSVAARHTADRRENFDIYLPLWLAKHNKSIFGTLYVAGAIYALARWLHTAG
jgi:hypothetical protein